MHSIRNIFIAFLTTTILTTSPILGQEESNEIQTLFGDTDREFFGAFSFGAANLDNQWGIQVGGKGGVLINDKIALGGVGNAYFNYTYKGAKDLSASDYRLIMGAGGIFVEYLVRRENAVHLSFPLNFLIGSARIKGRNDRETLERSIFFAFEPGISLEFNATPYFIPSINLSYRIVTGSSMTFLSDKELSGVNLGLVFKFGYRGYHRI